MGEESRRPTNRPLAGNGMSLLDSSPRAGQSSLSRQDAVRGENEPLRGRVTARILAAEPVLQEQPDFDGFRFATRTIWILLFLGSPVMIVYGLFQLGGILPALLALGLLLFGLRFLSPTNLFSLFHLAALLNPAGRRNHDPVPVRYYRVRTVHSGQEHIVRMKGRLTLGNIQPDDIVTFQGSWRGGILRAFRAFNHRSRAEVAIGRSYSWVGFVVSLFVLGALILMFAEPVGMILSRVSEL